ncbi:MAG: Aldo/keto reductase family protein [Firmicutes bacterium]|nr:Aldo/keto reductase family protein [Bacillota bacterium]
MEYRVLGRTELNVSRLCFGALTVGPLQAKMPLREGADVIRTAFAAGVNFIDTAELYETYDYIREALSGYNDKIIVSSKSYAYTYSGMRDSVHKACQALGRDYIDIFMLHEQTSRMTLKGHWEALEFLVDAKRKGLVRAIGVSTHTVDVVRAAALIDEIDVIHPILNMRGIGICGGTVEEMLSAIELATYTGKGIYTMKALGGGHLSSVSDDAFQWILERPNINAVAVGMQSLEEVAVNCAVFSNRTVDKALKNKVTAKKRQLLVEDWCIGCGNCAEKCPMGAIVVENGKAVSFSEKCVLCGYCGAYCPEFCLKII